jgi:hypothetical protein
MAEHSSGINNHKRYHRNLIGYWIKEQKGYKVADALKGRFEPVAVIGIGPRRVNLFMMDLMNRKEDLHVKKNVGYVEPQVVAQNMCSGLK